MVSDLILLVVVEDHYPEGGLGEAVRSALGTITVPLIHLSVTKLPRSGKASELLEFEGISAGKIVETIKNFIHR